MSRHRVRAIVTVEVTVTVEDPSDGEGADAADLAFEEIAQWTQEISAPRADDLTAMATADDIRITETEDTE